MKYSKENLMHLLGNSVQTLRRQTFGGPDRSEGPMGRRAPVDGEERRGPFEGREVPNDGDRRGWFGTDPRQEIPSRARGFGGPGRGEGPMGRRVPFARERILRFIGEQEPISQNRLSELLGVRPQSLSETLKKLEQDGYIRRAKNEADKRETLVTLTDAGRQRQEEVQAVRTEQVERFLAPLTEEEQQQLFSLLCKLTGTKQEDEESEART